MNCYKASFAGIPTAKVPVEACVVMVGAKTLAQAARKAEDKIGDLGELVKIERTDEVIL